MKISIDPEFHALIPPLSSDELAQLEANIKADGCRDPLVVWRGLIVDGHNRHEICERNDLKFDTTPVDLGDREEVKAWIIRNQFGRRNLNNFQRAELALKLEPLIAAKAKGKQRQGGREKLVQTSAQAAEKTRDVLARAAGVSHDTIAKAKVIAEKAPEPVKQMLRAGEVSINAAYTAVAPKRARITVEESQDDGEEYPPVPDGPTPAEIVRKDPVSILGKMLYEFWGGVNSFRLNGTMKGLKAKGPADRKRLVTGLKELIEELQKLKSELE